MASVQCWHASGLPAEGHRPCGPSYMRGMICCPNSYECRDNGLCSLPENVPAIKGHLKEYPANSTFRNRLLWMQLPSFTYKAETNIFEDSGDCISSDGRPPEGFVPVTGCDNVLRTEVPEGDWFSCYGKSSCEESQSSMQLFGGPGKILCPVGSNETCASINVSPYGDYNGAPARNHAHPATMALIIVLPLILFGILALVGVCLYRRSRKLLAMDEEEMPIREPFSIRIHTESVPIGFVRAPPPPYREHPTTYQRVSSFCLLPWHGRGEKSKSGSPPEYPGPAYCPQ